MARASGAGRIVITGTEADEIVRLPIARKLGIDHVVNVERENLGRLIEQLTIGEGVDTIVETSGAPSAILETVDHVKRGGRILAIGETPQDEVPFRWSSAIFKGCSLAFNFSANPMAWKMVLDLMALGRLDVKPLITHRIDMADFRKGFEMLESKEALKVIMRPFAKMET
jgi:L-iditol 2-dehydrogenase